MLTSTVRRRSVHLGAFTACLGTALALLASVQIATASNSELGGGPASDDTHRFAPDPIYKSLAPQAEALLGDESIPSDLSVQQWATDLDALAAHLRARVPYFVHAYGPDFDRRLKALKQSLPDKTRDQRALSLFQLLNAPAAGTGHFRIRPMQRALGWRALPLRLYRFADGVHVIAALDDDLIGREVLAIDGVPIKRVYERLAPYVSADNRFHRLRRTEEQLLRWINPLHAAGITKSNRSVSLELGPEPERAHRTVVHSVRPGSKEWQRYLDAVPRLSEKRTWSPVAEYVDNREPFYRVEYESAAELLYLQFNTVYNESDFDAFSDRSIADLAAQLRNIIETGAVTKVVVDLRTNTGGDFTLIAPLIDLLAEHPALDRQGALYTLISPVTFSAAGVFAATLERRTKTLFVGEPGGFSPNQWGEVVPVMLPESKITVHISYAYYAFDLPDAQRAFIKPDLQVPLTSTQYFSNQDLAMEAVRNHQPAAIESVALSEAGFAGFEGRYRLSPIHLAKIEQVGTGLRLEIVGQSYFPDLSGDATEVFLESDLYPVSADRMRTEIRDVFLQRMSSGELVLFWKGTPYTLAVAKKKMRTPLAHFRSGDPDRGADIIRTALAGGMQLGNDITEYPFRRMAENLRRRRADRAALDFLALAAEFAPLSWRVHADVADALRALSRPASARRAQARANLLNPAL